MARNWKVIRDNITDHMHAFTHGDWDLIFDDDTSETLNRAAGLAGLSDLPFSADNIDHWLEDFHAGKINLPRRSAT